MELATNNLSVCESLFHGLFHIKLFILDYTAL